MSSIFVLSIYAFFSLPRPLNGSTFKEFCLDNFDEVAYLKPTKLPDWKENPSTFSAISNAKMKYFFVESLIFSNYYQFLLLLGG